MSKITIPRSSIHEIPKQHLKHPQTESRADLKQQWATNDRNKKKMDNETATSAGIPN
jgi:hypothetical protein